MVYGPCDSCCLCLGSVATYCCKKDEQEGICSPCNHCCCFGPMCCECCPCGKDGCIGYPNHLCGCCGNCNLMWYQGCCLPCFLADMHVAGAEDLEDPSASWASVMCNLILLQFLVNILSQSSNTSDPDEMDTVTIVAIIASSIGMVLEIVLAIYTMLLFGRAANRIARRNSMVYEPGEYCESCCSDTMCAGCCTSCECCCAYFCCLVPHMLQVARFMETSEELQTKIMNGRPEQCGCCNCWKQGDHAPLQAEDGQSDYAGQNM